MMKMMEEKLIKGGEVISKASKQEGLLRKAEQELRERQQQEARLARELAEKEEANLQLEGNRSPLVLVILYSFFFFSITILPAFHLYSCLIPFFLSLLPSFPPSFFLSFLPSSILGFLPPSFFFLFISLILFLLFFFSFHS